MESIALDKEFSRDSDCWKLTSFCRDVFGTPEMDEFGQGPNPLVLPDGPGTTTIVALLAALLAFGLVYYYVTRGGRRKRREEEFGDIQFASIRSQDIM